jgi:hypothetical protein
VLLVQMVAHVLAAALVAHGVFRALR